MTEKLSFKSNKKVYIGIQKYTLMEIESPFDTKKITTIKLKSKTKQRIDHLRVYRRETYDEIIEKILDVLNLCRLNPEAARAKLIAIDKAKRKNLKVSEK
jgi:hypothetical protein